MTAGRGMARMVPSLSLVVAVVAVGPRPSDPTPRQVQASQPSSLEALGWLAGHWRGVMNGISMEEFWTAPGGRMMVGMHRDVFSSGGAFFEYSRIEARDDGIVYLASPGGRSPATTFALTSSSERHVVFENPDHDFPQWIEYSLHGRDTLRARARGVENGRPREEVWLWQRLVPR